jgi:hypothetical protein
MREILGMFGGYQLSREEIIAEVKKEKKTPSGPPVEECQKIKKTAFSLLKDGQIVRVWWDEQPSPDEISGVINQVEGAVAR